MAIKLKETGGGKVMEVHVSGKLTHKDYKHFVPEFERMLKNHGKLRVLFEMAGFRGWSVSALWDDLKFDVKHFSDIERLAMVGDKKWEKGMTAFCKPFTKAKIRYFDRSAIDEARAWLTVQPGRSTKAAKKAFSKEVKITSKGGQFPHEPSAEEIAARAYQIYEKAGRPEGRDREHWLAAEAQIAEEQTRPVRSARTPSDSTRSLARPRA